MWCFTGLVLLTVHRLTSSTPLEYAPPPAPAQRQRSPSQRQVAGGRGVRTGTGPRTPDTSHETGGARCPV